MSDVGPGRPPVEHQFKPGVSGNPAGKPKGSKHISTHIQKLMEDDSFVQKLKNGDELIGAPVMAIIKAAIAKAISGDKDAREWLAKYGWGNKIIHEFENSLFSENSLTIKVVKSDNTDPEREAGDSESPAQ